MYEELLRQWFTWSGVEARIAAVGCALDGGELTCDQHFGVVVALRGPDVVGDDFGGGPDAVRCGARGRPRISTWLDGWVAADTALVEGGDHPFPLDFYFGSSQALVRYVPVTID